MKQRKQGDADEAQTLILTVLTPKTIMNGCAVATVYSAKKLFIKLLAT